jgi:hypothetical protein
MSFFRKITSLLSTSTATVSFTDAERAMRREQKRQDPGAFTYEEDGFFYAFMTETRKINWASIDKIVAYKQDLISADEICIDIIYDNWVTTFTEETPGWYIFLEKIKAIFPNIPPDWSDTIVQPSFDTQLMVLYERDKTNP